MSERCRETAGILFKRRCPHPATQACGFCRKPMCLAHTRKLGDQEACIACARTRVQRGEDGTSLAYLQDDPYFYWYYHRESWYGSDYSDSDYEHFDRDWGGSLGSEGDFSADDQWEGT